jgi:hypothetical protein
VDMSDDLAIIPIIRDTGVVIYGKRHSKSHGLHRKRKATS